MGVGRFWRVLGIPRAEARLLAIDEDRSLAFGLRPLGSLGGCMAFSGEGGRAVSEEAVVVTDPVSVAAAGLEGPAPSGFWLLS